MSYPFMLPASLDSLRNYVDGEFVSTERQFDNISPLHGRLLGRVHEADAALVDRAVQAARKALEGPWGHSTVDERAAWLHKVADVIERRFDEFVAAEVADTGRPVTQARNLDVFRAIANLRTFADLGKVAHGDCFESRTAQGEAAPSSVSSSASSISASSDTDWRSGSRFSTKAAIISCASGCWLASAMTSTATP